MLTETLLKQPGFLYKIGQKHYYLGKWICKECTESDASDCVMMYHMCRNNQEEPDTNMYFQKLRAFSDFALEVPCNPAKTKADLTLLVNNLSAEDLAALQEQVTFFEEDLAKYCR